MTTSDKQGYNGFILVIAKSNGQWRIMAWGPNKEKLGPFCADAHEAAITAARAGVDGYWIMVFEKDKVHEDDRKLFKALAQMPGPWKGEVAHQLEQYARVWSQATYVRFGMLGRLADGEPGAPNYQIESEDGRHRQAFTYHHNPSSREEYELSHLTERRYDLASLARCGFPRQ